MCSARSQMYVAVLVLAVCLVGLKADRPSYIDCVDSNECGPQECCVLGHSRFSIPSCQPLQGAYSHCRPRGHNATTTTVSYPNGDKVTLTNIYYTFCTCAPGLTCSEETATCRDD